MNPLRYINALSLDVMVGAIAGCLFFGNLLNSPVPIEVHVALALAIWSVYTLDHLWDAYRSEQPSRSLRHRLHKRYFLIFSIIVTLTMLTGCLLAFYLPVPTRSYGIALMVAVSIYFITIQTRNNPNLYHKEFLVAVIYTLGIVAGPFSLAGKPIGIPEVMIISQYASLAFINLILFACFEFDADQAQNFGSLARSIGKKNTWCSITAILVLVLVSATALIVYSDQQVIWQSEIIILLMTGCLLMLLKFQGYFKNNDRYRLVGDAIFIIPLLAL